MSFLGDVFSFELFNAGEMWKKIKKNPEQLLLGAADPFSANMWGKITGKEYTPIINQWGGASDDTYEKAAAAGINTGPGQTMHNIAQSIASIYAGGAAAGAFGGAAGGGAGGGGSTALNSVGPLAGGYAMPATAANSVGPLASGYAFGGGVTPFAAYTGAGAAPVSYAGAPSGGFNFSQAMDMLQNMPQGDRGGGGGGGGSLPPSPMGSAPTPKSSMLSGPYRGKVDLVSERRKKRRRGLLDSEDA